MLRIFISSFEAKFDISQLNEIGGRVSHVAVETDPNILTIARAMIADFGPNAADVVDRLADDHIRANDLETAELWRRVAKAVRDIFRGPIV